MRVGEALLTPNGNHRIAALAERFGLDTEVIASVDQAIHYRQYKLDYQLQRTRNSGIYTFNDYLAMIARGEFIDRD